MVFTEKRWAIAREVGEIGCFVGPCGQVAYGGGAPFATEQLGT